MTRIRLVLLVAVALMIPSLALAVPDVSVDSDPATLVDVLWETWGNWPYFVGAAVTLGLQAWRTYQPVVFDALDPRMKRVIPMVVAGLTAFAAALLVGGDFTQATRALTISWGTALIGGDLLRMTLGKPTRVG